MKARIGVALVVLGLLGLFAMSCQPGGHPVEQKPICNENLCRLR